MRADEPATQEDVVMTAEATNEEQNTSIEVHIDGTGIPAEELDRCTRRVASELRQLPHKSLGIVSDQAPAAKIETQSVQVPTQGVITIVLQPAILPKLLEVLRSGFLASERCRVRLKGPNATELELGDLEVSETVDIWLNAVIKHAVISASSSETNIDQDAPPLSSAQDMRDRARRHIESGAVTEEYTANRAQVVKILNEALATELICILRYKSHYYRALGINSESVKSEFLQHAQEAQQHADRLAARIVQLNGAPDFNPDGLASRSRSEYKPASTLVEMIKEDLIAERIAVEFYSEIIHWLGDTDLTTRTMMQSILEVEAQHANDMKQLLDRLTLREGRG
jgi:bacterioferritin